MLPDVPRIILEKIQKIDCFMIFHPIFELSSPSSSFLWSPGLVFDHRNKYAVEMALGVVGFSWKCGNRLSSWVLQFHKVWAQSDKFGASYALKTFRDQNWSRAIRIAVTKNQKWVPKSGIAPTWSGCISELRWSLTTNLVIFNTSMIVSKRLAQEWWCLERLGLSKPHCDHFLAKCPRTL